MWIKDLFSGNKFKSDNINSNNNIGNKNQKAKGDIINNEVDYHAKYLQQLNINQELKTEKELLKTHLKLKIKYTNSFNDNGQYYSENKK